MFGCSSFPCPSRTVVFDSDGNCVCVAVDLVSVLIFHVLLLGRTAVDLLGGGRALYKNNLLNMDVSYRKLCRQIVGHPPGRNWSLDWHETLHF